MTSRIFSQLKSSGDFDDVFTRADMRKRGSGDPYVIIDRDALRYLAHWWDKAVVFFPANQRIVANLQQAGPKG